MTEDPRVELENIEAELARRSLKRFVYAAWTILEPDVNLVWNWHLDVLCDELESISRGELKRLIINVPPGTMKQISYNADVLTKRGRLTLGQVVVGDEILTHEGRFQRVRAISNDGLYDMLRITTRNGRQVDTEVRHPFLTPRGWVPANELQVGDILAAVVPQEDPFTDQITAKEARLLGYLVGDGSVTHSPSFINADEDILRDFEHVATSCGIQTKRRALTPSRKKSGLKGTTLGIRGSLPFIRKHGLLGKSSYTKRIPAAVLASSREVIANFLGAYWSCDGCIHIRNTSKRGSRFISYATTVSEELARDLQHALLRIGINARVRRRTRKLSTRAQSGGVYVYWHVEATSHHGAAQFKNMPGLCPAKNELLQGLRLQHFERGPLREDEICAIEPVGRGLCRCLDVEEDHSFTASDLAVHNSLLVSVFWPAWEWASNPGLRILTASYGDRVAERDNVKMRDIILSPWYQRQYNVQLRMDQSAKQKFYTYAGGWRICTTTSGAGTGEHPDRLIIDDPHKADDAKSKIKLESVSDWYSRTISTRGASRGTAIILIMQRLAMADLSAFLEKAGGWKHLVFPMRYEPARGHYLDPRETKGELLWSELFPNEILKPIERLLGPYGTAGQMQQRPTPEGGGLFKRDWLPIITRAELPPREDMVLCRGWDTAGSEGEGDHTVGVLMGFHDENYYVLDVRRGQWGPMKVDRQMKQAAHNDGKSCRVREEREPGSSGKAVTERRRIDLAGYDYDDVTVNKDKETRARPLRSQCEGGHVFLLEGSWNEPYIQEMIVFDRGLFDDQVDGSSVAFNELATVGEIALVDLVW